MLAATQRDELMQPPSVFGIPLAIVDCSVQVTSTRRFDNRVSPPTLAASTIARVHQHLSGGDSAERVSACPTFRTLADFTDLVGLDGRQRADGRAEQATTAIVRFLGLNYDSW